MTSFVRFPGLTNIPGRLRFIMKPPFGSIGAATAFILLFSTGVTYSQSKIALDDLVSPEFWDMTSDAFVEKYKNAGFRWNSAAKNSARADGIRVPLEIKANRVGETIVVFEEGKPKQYQISIHARGDDGQIPEETFDGLVEKWTALLDEVTGVSGEERGKDNSNAVRAEGITWTTDSVAYLLEHSSQKEVRTRNIPFRSEFIRLRALPYKKKSFMEEKLAEETRVSRADLPANVKKENGDTFIEGIPMVDQGMKGYCVVASTARVFGYYDMQVTQNEIAQIANSSAEGGTSTTGMIEALDDIAGRFKVRVKTHEAMDYDDMKDLSEDYNRIAKREGGRMVSEGANQNQWYNFDAFDGEILKKTRLKSESGIKKFKSEIEKSIDLGIPLLWTVTVGIYEEPKRISQTRGGHMRMIIGYNWEKDQIIFSDSWGAGHEFKHWGVEEAYCSTKGLYSVMPIK